MLNIFKRKPSQIFEGFYWAKDKTWDLIPFKVGAKSEEEARELLSKEKNFKMICYIGVVK